MMLVLALPLAGCVGILTDDGSNTDDDAQARARADAVEHAGSGADDGGTEYAALVFMLRSASASRIELKVRGVDAEGPGMERAGFAAKPVRVDPGTERAIGAIAVPTGTTLGPLEVKLTLHDGLGESTLPFTVDAIDLHQDARVNLTLAAPVGGTVEVVAIEGPTAVHLPRERAEPQYGYLAWPSGAKRVLPDFPYVVEVPESYPWFERGREVAFSIRDEDAGPVTWRYDDGRRKGSGHHFEVTPGPGRHTLALTAGEDGSTAVLDLHVNDFLEFTDEAPVGHYELSVPVEGVNGNWHAFEVYAHNTRSIFTLLLQSNVSTSADLDLYVYDEQGREVIQAINHHQTHEYVEIPFPLAPGRYKAWVQNADGVGVAYSLQVFLQY